MKITIIIEDELSKKGVERTETKISETIEITSSMYSKWFNDTCNNWTKDPEFNRRYLQTQQAYANDLLKARGYLFLNDVYDMIGIPRTKEGEIVGWVYDERNRIGDNFVDFDLHNECNSDFMNGCKTDALLDFNVDGVIIHRI